MHALKKINTLNNEIWIDDDGILMLVLTGKEIEMELEEVKECFEAYKTLGCGPHNKVLQLIDFTGEGTMTAEARNYVAETGCHFFIASAIVNNSLAVRLIVNFFNTFYKHPIPFKMFSNEKEARAWLMTFRK
ncbi:MAG: hypothetical protein H0W73_10675 [Bacteroidetes bacterium]|nr:hypothetical protein [Bacteroidota bacterium]